MRVNGKKGVVISILFSLILHSIFILAFYYLLKKKPLFPSKFPPIPKQTFVDIVTLPKKSHKTEKVIKEKHKIGANISRKGMAKVYSNKELLPFGFESKPLMSAKKPSPPTALVKKPQAKPNKKSEKKKVVEKTEKKQVKPHKLVKKGFTQKKSKPIRKVQKKSKSVYKKVSKKIVRAKKRERKGRSEKVIRLSGNLIKPYNLKPGFLSGKAFQYEYKRAKREATISIGTQSLKYASYLEHIKNKIENVWAYPTEAARTGQQGTLLILFTINKNGDLIRLKLVRSSGYPLLDRAALQAIRDASPFPPLPKRFNLDILNIYATFEYDLGFRYVY